MVVLPRSKRRTPFTRRFFNRGLVLGGIGLVRGSTFYYFRAPEFNISESIFESFSGLTTTGATVITGLDSLPKAILFYRQFLQWLGGMGIIVLAIAIIPLIGLGKLYRAEMPGPLKDQKCALGLRKFPNYFGRFISL
ncbi:trk-type K+ transport system, membrane component [Actinobacillus equuli]|nr:trk-type K+ transport system, membrane component [Actinobacillus equuli]